VQKQCEFRAKTEQNDTQSKKSKIEKKEKKKEKRKKEKQERVNYKKGQRQNMKKE
jgi:hypothetical protein